MNESDLKKILEQMETSSANVGKIIRAACDAAAEADATYLDVIQACQSLAAATQSLLQGRYLDLMEAAASNIGAAASEIEGELNVIDNDADGEGE